MQKGALVTTKPQSTTEDLAPCPKCNDCWALQVHEQRPPLLAKTVECGRCGFRAPFDTWQARISPSAAPVVDNWSKESPKVNGVYWWRADAKDLEPDIHAVVAGQFYQIGSSESVVVENFGGEWLGPITPTAAAPVEQSKEVALRIPTCGKCPFVDHSGAFTPGGAKPICGHRDAPDTFAASIVGDEHYHWHYRQVNPASAPPDQCPLRQPVTDNEGAR